jgi:hypothetical protein
MLYTFDRPELRIGDSENRALRDAPAVTEAFANDEIGVGHAFLLAKLQPEQQEEALAACYQQDRLRISVSRCPSARPHSKPRKRAASLARPTVRTSLGYQIYSLRNACTGSTATARAAGIVHAAAATASSNAVTER